jgi:transglutaminase-like putative cysteine protease
MAAGAARLHGLHRFHSACVLGMVLTGYVADLLAGFSGATWVQTFAIHALFGLALLRLGTARRRRDFALVQLVAFVFLLDGAIRSTSPWYFLLLLLFILFGVAASLAGQIVWAVERSRAICRAGLVKLPSRLAALSVAACLGILVTAAAIFFVLPRTARMAAKHLVSRNLLSPGFAGEILLARTGKLQASSQPVLHVRFDGEPGQVHLKWRGGALGEFDGKRWYNSPGHVEHLSSQGGVVWLMDNRRSWQGGRRISYEVTVHALGTSELFFAGNPLLVRLSGGQGVLRAPGDTFRTALPGGNLRYAAVSAVETPAGPDSGVGELSRDERNYYLLLPPFDARVLALARRLTAGCDTEEAKARAIEDYLRRNFSYTTELPAKPAADPLAHFLFERRKGHCEYFAGAMAVMLRAIWVPARIATGFQSGVYNPVSGWHAIRAADAHSWVEAWIPGRGWVSFDPTPPAPAAPAPGALARLWFYADAAETFWQEWVLNYDLDRQLTLASWVERSGRGVRQWWPDRLPELPAHHVLPVLAVALGAAIIGWFAGPRLARRLRIRRNGAAKRAGEANWSEATLLYERLLRRLEREGIRKPGFQTPLEFARSLRSPELAAEVEALTRAYNRLRFGREAEAAAELLQSLKTLESRGKAQSF